MSPGTTKPPSPIGSRGRIPPMRADLGLAEGYHSPQVEVDVRLNTNESAEPPPPAFTNALQAEMAGIDFHRYPDRAATKLRQGLADLHRVLPANVFCANGSNEAIQLLLLAYGGTGRTALTFEPTYALHSHIAAVTGTKVATGVRQPDFTVDVDEVKRMVTEAEPVITFLCSPNNPTGNADPPETVSAALDLVPGLLVVDEAYGQFARWSAVEWVKDGRPLVVVRTFSKTWSMAALRLGYVVAPAQVVAALERVALPYHLDAVKQIAGVLALDHRQAMEARVESVQRERQRVVDGLSRLPLEVWPSDANFILFRPLSFDGAAVWRALVDRSVLVRDCSSWPGLEGCLRVTIGTRDEDDRFLAALEEVLS